MYAAHIKTSLDTGAINVMRTKKSKKALTNSQVSTQPPEQETDA